jgi:hypothetical protein
MRHRGERAQAFGQATRLRVDHPGGDVVPVPVAGLLADREALADLIAQPPVELGQAGRDPRLALLPAFGHYRTLARRQVIYRRGLLKASGDRDPDGLLRWQTITGRRAYRAASCG